MKTLNLNVAVFTTRQVIVDKSPIVYVSHDRDGDWQFFGEEKVSVSDARLVSLVEIIQLDQSINKILSMPINHYAIRQKITDDWTILSTN